MINKISEDFGFIAAPETQAEKDVLERFIQEVESETVRGKVLNIISFIDELIITILLTYFPNREKSEKLLLNDLGGCLGTIMYRANICHALSLISDTEFNWIKLIAHVRNEFAHNWNDGSFGCKKVIKYTGQLHHPFFETHEATPRAKFMFITGELVQHLSRRNEYAKLLREKLPDKELVGKLKSLEPKCI